MVWSSEKHGGPRWVVEKEMKENGSGRRLEQISEDQDAESGEWCIRSGWDRVSARWVKSDDGRSRGELVAGVERVVWEQSAVNGNGQGETVGASVWMRQQ